LIAVAKCFLVIVVDTIWTHAFGSHLCVFARGGAFNRVEFETDGKAFCAIILLLVVLSGYASFFSLFVVPLPPPSYYFSVHFTLYGRRFRII
jgi:hypothetical protein